MYLVIDDRFRFAVEDHGQFAVVSKKELHPEEDVQRRRIGKFDSVVSHRAYSSHESGCKPSLITYWSDTLLGAKHLCKELSELFPIELDSVYVDFDPVTVDYQALIRWLNQFEPRFEQQMFKGTEMDFSQYMWIIEHVKSKKFVEMKAKPKEYFKKETLKIDIEQFHVCHAKWIQIKHLQSLKCSRFRVFDVSLTETDINLFLKSLLAGSNPNLVDFAITREPDFDMDVVLDWEL